MEKLFLAHPVSFVAVVVVVALLVKALGTLAIEHVACLAHRAVRLRHRSRTVDTERDYEAEERAEERERIAVVLLASWTTPSFDHNGEKRGEVVDDVLLATALDAADRIIAARGKTPVEVIAANAVEIPSFSEYVKQQERNAAAVATA